MKTKLTKKKILQKNQPNVFDANNNSLFPMTPRPSGGRSHSRQSYTSALWAVSLLADTHKARILARSTLLL
jgi:hypothetical protein